MKFGLSGTKRSSNGVAETTALNSSERPKSPKRSKRRRTALFQDGLAALCVAAFLFFGATAREVNLLLALGALFAGFVALDYFWGRRTLRRLSVARTTPDVVFAGEPFYIAIEIRNVGKRASWAVVVEDRWTPESRLAAAASSSASSTTLRPVAYFPKIRGGETRKATYSGFAPRRGRRRLESLTVSTRFPCGFFRSSERFDAPDEMLVFPKIGGLTDAWRAFAGEMDGDATVATGRSSRIPDETLTVRDWRTGDSKKAIHWRATAKRGRLQARDFTERKSRTIFLLLDLFDGRDEKTDKNGVELKKKEKIDARAAYRRWENVELAVSFAATALDHWTRARDAKFYFAVNGDDAFSFVESSSESVDVNAEKNKDNGSDGFLFRKNGERSAALVVENPSVWSDGSDGGAFRRFLIRLATVESPRRDRFAEIIAEIDPITLADAQIFVVSVVPFEHDRLTPTEANGDQTSSRSEKTAAQIEVWGQNARFIDVSSDEFSDFFNV